MNGRTRGLGHRPADCFIRLNSLIYSASNDTWQTHTNPQGMDATWRRSYERPYLNAGKASPRRVAARLGADEQIFQPACVLVTLVHSCSSCTPIMNTTLWLTSKLRRLALMSIQQKSCSRSSGIKYTQTCLVGHLQGHVLGNLITRPLETSKSGNDWSKMRRRSFKWT